MFQYGDVWWSSWYELVAAAGCGLASHIIKQKEKETG